MNGEAMATKKTKRPKRTVSRRLYDNVVANLQRTQEELAKSEASYRQLRANTHFQSGEISALKYALDQMARK